MTNLRVWVHTRQAAKFAELQAEAYSYSLVVRTFPMREDDLCYELVPVSKEQLEREANEGIKALDEEMKNGR